MAVSVFDVFKIGIGPSSSHTVGPMKAAAAFVTGLTDRADRTAVERVTAELYGSLALTGVGHATDSAVLLGLLGEWPDTVDPERIPALVDGIRRDRRLALGGGPVIAFAPDRDLLLHKGETLPGHPNGMRLTARDAAGNLLDTRVYYSVGGGFVVTEEELHRNEPTPGAPEVPYDFNSADEMLALARDSGRSIAALVRDNERVTRSDEEIDEGMRRIWGAMKGCVARGITQDGVLPGGLKVRRRAAALYRDACGKAESALRDPMAVMDWISVYAIAVNEENAAGGRVVTAPTNGAAGIVPAVLHYYDRFCHNASERGIFDFLLTATAIATLYKKNASISGAEVGCQGEVGVACSMAAGGLAAALGGTPAQIENAAEIGMEHNLGLTCDPIGGLVQIPCIERNAIGAVKAINAARLALNSDGLHHVSLDKVIRTMRETGADMQTKYKETSLGGLAVNVVEC
ncbi:L-serine ammonia-lyase [Azospirillum griseum]|uniref:L-serine dehydratase n=1 Tax=Azospirillum griseum TaxID=2496639 RepID=A0A3S0IDA9_9PROT|nr:L-serine ammonia-lyase [Azospirillum griseum]RTR17605.1 L-serine ammonia-lyase [Azospirillum griseum]